MELVQVNNSQQVSQFCFTSNTKFQQGRFVRFDNGHGVLACCASGLHFVFGPEAIDLGPCCDSSCEDWARILKPDDILLFSRGYNYLSNNIILRTAKQVVVPETCNDCNFLSVVLRQQFPTSVDGATAAVFCPPFGIIKLHKFAFGYEPCSSWPLMVGARFWVALDKEGPGIRVWKIHKKADNCEFGRGTTQLMVSVPRLHLWQWNQAFDESGVFSITEYILKCLNEKKLEISVEKDEMNWQEGLLSIENDAQNCESRKTEDVTNTRSDSAALSLLLKILNDTTIRELIIERHQQAFENYLSETSLP
ncbi:unnamed protein product [Thelazia callipaeda]|uniref:Uncharacterized protein n=1 Tax=Thelazia callipaeda TaxID=103827 RepID=A0A0N5DAU0_THECL|nr:unnamed protein product [Thelazia callipaeda]